MKSKDLEEIYSSYYQDIYLYALSLCKNEHEAQELVSDTFYKAFLSLNENGESVKYWLLKVCRNLFLDNCRKKKQWNIRPIEETITSIDLLLIERVLKDEETKVLYLGILKLSPGYKEIIYMFYFGDLSIAQIAKITGQSPGAVKTSLCRARIKLKHILEGGK